MKLYKDMTAEEQLQWVTDFTAFVENDVPALVNLKKWNSDSRKTMEKGLRLMGAFPYAQKYVNTALKFGDYDRRTYRLPYYVEKIKKEISASVTVTDANGKAFAYVPQIQQARRRGRPTREEAYLMSLQKSKEQHDVETEKQQRIAQMLGLEVVTNPVTREKNNAELQAEREAKAAAKAETSPTLFDQPSTIPVSTIGIEDPLPTLRQLSFLLSPELAERVNTIRDLRTQAGAFAEQAKVMAEHNDSEEAIAEVAQQAAQATEAYEQIYEDVDRELATVYLRLKEDQSFRSDFIKKHYPNVPHVAVSQQLSTLEKTLKHYYQKQDSAFTASVRQLIADSNPEVVAAKKAEKEKKEASEKIIKYLRRTDKANTPRRIQGMEQRYQELVAIIGEEQAKPYYAFVEAARADCQQKKNS